MTSLPGRESLPENAESKPDVTVAILTLNEEANLPQALRSVCGWAREVVVIDSGSQDRTKEIARSFGARVIENPFKDYSTQRNFALQGAGIETEWAFFLDADEWMPSQLRDEICTVVSSSPQEDGFLLRFRLMWMGRWVRRGYYPTWLLRLVRRSRASCEARAVNEHLVVEGRVGHLRADLIHEDRKSLTEWAAKQVRYAEAEARLLCAERSDATMPPLSTQAGRKRWLRDKVWVRLPPVARAFVYFGYRYVLRLGFLDGLAGLSFHFLQGLWLQVLIDLRYLELRRSRRGGGP
jgi:glycosyltransferase involved in cell wall biosynthesis